MASGRSKVPAHRLSRLGNMAALAGKVAGGMLAEGARQWAQGNSPSRQQLLLTPANISRVADKLAHLRGAAMKVGQLLSMDAGELLPPAMADILAKLRANANAMPVKQLSQVLITELGTDWQRRFADFTFVPMAAASIGQVHQAYHDNGTRLAIKIQYPGIKTSIDSDVNNVASLLRLSGLLPAGVNLQPLLDEAKRQLKNEADYQLEASYLMRYRALLADDADYVVPGYYADCSSSNILAMSYVDGIAVESLLSYPHAERNRVMQLLFSLLFRELFEFKLVQTDPNFANYLYNPDSKQLVLLDFGACREYSEQVSNAYRDLFCASLNNDHENIAKALTDIGFFSQNILPAQQQAVIAMVQLACEPLQQNNTFDFANSDLAVRLRDAGTALSMQQQYWHAPPADALFLHRKIAGLYLLAARLKTQVNVRQILQPYLKQSCFKSPAVGELV